MKQILLLATLFFFGISAQSQLSDSCKLNIGTNLNGLADYGTELPFVNLMRNCRTWYTKSIGDAEYPFDSGFSSNLDYRTDGYPTHVPQSIAESDYDQEVVTIWGITSGWPVGEYTVLWEGTGSLYISGTIENLTTTNPHRAIFDLLNPIDGVVEIIIETSDIADPIHNIRVLMPGTEFTYEAEPFYDLWVEKVNIFETVRFMDWGSTNGWGTNEGEGFGDGTLADWDERSKMDTYTWAHNKGVPYEMMVRFMNDHDKDGWVCIPHTASEDYVRNMAAYFRDNLEPDRHIYIEYSNEIWNFIFPQFLWTNEYGCILPEVDWPEGTVPFIQNVLDYWTDEFTGELDRTTRIVGIFTGWLDVAQRVAFNMDSTSFDAISPTYYFSINETLENELDVLGASATVANIADFTRQSMAESFQYISEIKTELADVINKPLMFYEGGQHLTPVPFAVEPTYHQALLDIHRDTSMYNLYNEWFDDIRTLQEGDEPLLLMNFSFVGHRSASFGSWGVLETMDQDLAITPAPKYQALIENMNTNCMDSGTDFFLKAFLQGPYNELSLLMNDNYRQDDNIPLTEPYTDLGFMHVLGGGETTVQSVLDVTGDNAIVDWIMVELRDGNNTLVTLATQSALLQRDGDIVGMDGITPIRFNGLATSVYVVLRHRNHFGVRTLSSVNTNTSITIDFSDPNTGLYGMNATLDINGVMTLISGDANKDGQVNAVDKNDYWRLENGLLFDYFDTKADFNMDGIVNPVDKNDHWRANNSKIEQLD